MRNGQSFLQISMRSIAWTVMPNPIAFASNSQPFLSNQNRHLLADKEQ